MATATEVINFSLDTETLGTRPGSVVTEVAIVNDYTADELHLYLHPVAQELLGMTTDQATIDWHQKENPNFDTMVANCRRESPTVMHLIECLQHIRKHIETITAHTSADAAIWMNSPSFDSIMLHAMFDLLGMPEPWHYRCERDLRTLRQLALAKQPDLALPEKPENAHDALVDAKHQLEIVTICLRELRL